MTEDQNELFTKCWTQAQPAVATFIFSAIPDFHEAEDVVQKVAVTVLRKFEDYDRTRSFTAWAMGMAKIELRAWRRKRAKGFLFYHPDLLDMCAATCEEFCARDVSAAEPCGISVRICFSPSSTTHSASRWRRVPSTQRWGSC